MRLFSWYGNGMELVHSLDRDLAEQKFPIHMHGNYELYCFVSGDAHYAVEGRIWKLEYGSVLLMSPGESHNLILNSPKPYERYTLNFSESDVPADLRELLIRLSEQAPEERNYYGGSEFSGVTPLDLFRAMCAGNAEDAPLRIRAFLPALLALLGQRKQKPETAANARTEGTEMVDWINAHLCDPVSLAQLAERFHRSISQTQRIFLAATGTTVGQYCRTKRLLRARQLIEGGTGAQAACAACGFGDYSSFFRLYKKQFGDAPSRTGK